MAALDGAALVVTRQADWQESGAQRASSLPEALALAQQSGSTTAWVCAWGRLNMPPTT